VRISTPPFKRAASASSSGREGRCAGVSVGCGREAAGHRASLAAGPARGMAAPGAAPARPAAVLGRHRDAGGEGLSRWWSASAFDSPDPAREGPDPAPLVRNPPACGPCCPARRGCPRKPCPEVSRACRAVRIRRRCRVLRAPVAGSAGVATTGDT
jgi:hypothetical protein